MVYDHIPDEDEIAEVAAQHLDDFPADDAYASVDIVYKAPDFLSIHEQDQVNAFLRDGSKCVLVIYMQEGVLDEDDDDDDMDDN